MARTKARELNANARQAQPYRTTNMRGRVTHADVWHRALARHRPGVRVTVTFDR